MRKAGFVTGFLLAELIIYKITGSCLLAILLRLLIQHLK